MQRTNISPIIGIFGNLNCVSPGSVTAVDDYSQGRVWRYSKPSGSNRCENLFINNGDEIRVEGARQSGEHARVDYIAIQ